MQSPFTEPVQANYLANLTISKKVNFLENQLTQSENHNKAIQKSSQSLKKTIDKLLKNRSNHEILVSMQHTIQQLEVSLKNAHKYIKQVNAQLLIEQQLRHQQRIDSLLKINQLQSQIDSLKCKMKDKDYEYIVILGRLKKYEDLKELMVKNKLDSYEKKLPITEKDKIQIIKQLSEELDKYKSIVNIKQRDIDKKIAVLSYGLKKSGYEQFIEEFKSMKLQDQASINYKLSRQFKPEEKKKSLLKPSNIWSSIKGFGQSNKQKDEIMQKLSKSSNSAVDIANKQLIKQLKKYVLGYRLLQNVLNKSIQRNQELLTYNQILIQSNQTLDQRLRQYKRLDSKILQKNQNFKINVFNKSKKISQNSQNYDYSSFIKYQEQFEAKFIQNYLKKLRSENYEVNIQQIKNDVHKMSQFLILSVSKNSINPHRSLSMDKIRQNSIYYQEKKKKIEQDQYKHSAKPRQTKINQENDQNFEIVEH